MNSITPIRIATLAALVFASGACNRAPDVATSNALTAEDVRIGRQAISVSEVCLLARSGYQKEALADVKRRHIPEEISAEEELQLRGYAKNELLLAALKDPTNILTPSQKSAYDEAKGAQAIQKAQAADAQDRQANNQRQQSQNQNQQANAASSAEQQEIQRRNQLAREASYVAEQRLAEQAAHEREQRRSVDARWKSMEAQNDRHRTYGTPPPVRRYRPPGN